MCTIVVLNRVHPQFPVVIAANRDEFYARETAPPRALRKSPRIVGGLDRRQGGTWLGLTPEGAFAAVTNQRDWFPPTPAPRSRGEIPISVLEAVSAPGVTDLGGAARAHLRAMDPGEHASFNLMFAEPRGAQVAYGRREAGITEVFDLPAGIHVLANDRLRSPDFPKLARAESLIEPTAAAPWSELAGALAALLSDHALPPVDSIEEPPPGSRFTRELAHRLQAICIHTPSYGTRSATIVALRPGGVAHYLFADGPPCEAEFQDLTRLVSGD